MSHVFISYVRENESLVLRLTEELRSAGIETWLDRDQIRPGERWKRTIRKAIKDGAFFLACFSAEYSAREKTYMNEELTLAIEELRRQSSERIWFIPVIISKCSVPDREISTTESLRDFQWIDLSEGWAKGVSKIVEAVSPGAPGSCDLRRGPSPDGSRALLHDDKSKESDHGEVSAPLFQDIETIAISDVLGPLVILWGPVASGKTTALLRLCSHVAPRFEIGVDRLFRVDRSYSAAIERFRCQLKEAVFAPPATAMFDFLLLNLTVDGNFLCQFLEAPGEHYFSGVHGVGLQHPPYLRKILSSGARKIFVLFFEREMFTGDFLHVYAQSIVGALQGSANAGRDRVIILFNKCDEMPHLLNSGNPIETEFRNVLYQHSGLEPLFEFLRRGRFARVHFVPFSSGSFGIDGQGRQTYARSADRYPKALWRAIYRCLKRSWF